MVKSDSRLNLPTGDELPESDGLPVDNELHTLIPNLLRSILSFIWAKRSDWFFGLNMGIYHPTAVHPRVPIVPDAFLSLGVERIKRDRYRRSYVVWEENNIVPTLTIEVVSYTPGGEYDEKIEIYARMGVLYYLVYNPDFWRRDGHEPLEVYRLVNGVYQRQIGEPFWMPEVGLAIGRSIGEYMGIEREWLYWYDRQRTRYLTPEELLQRYQEWFGELPKNGQ